MITHEIPGMSPRAIASKPSRASDAAGASQTTRSAGRPTSMVPTESRNARALLPVASAIASAGATPPSEDISHTVFRTPIGLDPPDVARIKTLGAYD